MEKAAYHEDPRITNTDDSGTMVQQAVGIYATSDGLCASYHESSFWRIVAVVASENGNMQKERWYSWCRHYDALEPPEEVGRHAARRALRQLQGKKVKTMKVPVVLDSMMAGYFLGMIARAINGYAIYRKGSFLCGKLGETVASPLVTIRDDALLPRLLGSRPFDREGVASRSTTVIERGILSSYLLDTYAAKKLGLATTGNASGTFSVAPSNFFLEPGLYSPEEIIASVPDGFYVIDLQGSGVNIVNGDCSVGARGMWIEHGELSYPVQEVTIAGNLGAMLKEIEMVGNDLVFHSPIASPTIKFAELTVAGI